MRTAQVGQRGVFQLETRLLGDHRGAGQYRDVLEHRLATIAKTRRLDGAGLQHSADRIDHQGCQRFPGNVFGDQQQRLGFLGDLFEQRQQIADRCRSDLSCTST